MDKEIQQSKIKELIDYMCSQSQDSLEIALHKLIFSLHFIIKESRYTVTSIISLLMVMFMLNSFLVTLIVSLCLVFGIHLVRFLT